MNDKEAIRSAIEVMRRQHKSLSTERTYVHWLGQYIRAVRQMPNALPSEQKMERFLTELALKRDVAASTQNQAFNAILFFYRDVLRVELKNINALRATRPQQERVAPSLEDTRALLAAVKDAGGYPANLAVHLLYGCGLRVSEAISLRVKDVHLSESRLFIMGAKGGKDRVVKLPWGAQSREHAGKHAPNISALSANQVKAAQVRQSGTGSLARTPGLKAKDLCMIPARVAMALQADGWYLRSDIVWAKQNCMPESVTDRPTRSHEFIFLLTKSPRYFYDHEAIKEPCLYDVDGSGTASRKARTDGNKLLPTVERNGLRADGFKDPRKMNGKHALRPDKQRGHSRKHQGFNERWDALEKVEQCTGMRNKRDVWWVAPACYPEAHFATFPPDLIKPCILAGSRGGDTVLDPFGGSGTTGQVALELGRKAILIELNPHYLELARQRCAVTPGLPFQQSGTRIELRGTAEVRG